MANTIEHLTGEEVDFLRKYAPMPNLDSESSCEYCGNGCGTSDCMSCCSSADDYFPRKE